MIMIGYRFSSYQNSMKILVRESSIFMNIVEIYNDEEYFLKRKYFFLHYRHYSDI